MTKDITLFEHNEKAYEALVSSLEKNSLAFIEHATGTGKSFILLKYLYTKMRNKKILFITRHYEMLEQLFHEQMESLGLTQKDFVQFDSIIYPNILDLDMNEIIKKYDCIVWDEAHHCGAPKWSVKVNEAKELVKKNPGKIMIGATATRIRYLDDYMDVAEKFFDGNVASVLPVTRAILKNLLPSPMIIMTAQACLEQIEKLQKKLRRVPQVPIVQEYKENVTNLENELSDELYVGNVLKKYGLQKGEKYIVFCSDINDLKCKMKEATHWFNDIGPVKMYSAHSAQKRSENIKQISEFSKKREEISLMFAVDIFNEGFHIDGVDGILIFRKTKSPIVYWQQLGRALSFSARKKQIRIFDFANNTSENKVVYELYKEMIEEARRLIIEDPQNKAVYEEILSHFQIVDQTASILDKLREIETKIDNDFIISSRIDLAIYKLEEYRAFYPNTNFNEELSAGRLGFEYVRTYNYICEVEDYLNMDQILRLKKLNINFTAKIDLPSSKRMEILGENKTFKELEDAKLEEFISKYVDFCIKNNRRPTINDNRDLYLSYREYLRILSRGKLSHLLARVPFRLTLEETIILGSYPSRDDINNYIDVIKEKVNNNIPLDAVEIKVLKKISHVISDKDTELLNSLNKYTDPIYQIDEAIAVIKDYKSQDDILDTTNYKRALRTIDRLAMRVTNRQFAILLELGIILPKRINMTMEKRLKELNGFDSFYEKNQNENVGALNSYLKFIKEYKRRPKLSDSKEAVLQSNYEKQLFKTTVKKASEVSTCLVELDIPLTFSEKVLSKRNIDVSELEEYITTIRTKLKNDERISNEELKILRMIEKNQYPLNIGISNFIKMIININMIDDMIINYQSGILNEFQKKGILRNIFARGRFITRGQSKRLIALNIDVPHEITDSFNDYPDFINYFEQEVHSEEEFWIEFMKFLSDNKRYPNSDDVLMQKYRYYLSYAPRSTVISILRKVESLGIPLSTEERILLQDFTREEGITYLESIKEKVKSGQELDSLESRVCRKLDNFLPTKDYNTNIKPAIVNASNDLENKIVRNLRSCIRLNPFERIDFDSNYSLSKQNRRRVEIYRINTLAKKVLPSILRTIKKEKKPVDKVIDDEIKPFYEELYSNKDLDHENEFLLNQIRSLNREYILRENGFATASFVAEYISFIHNSNGQRPNNFSEDEYERNLAVTYDEVHDFLDIKDIQKIEKALKSSLEDDDIEHFYPRLIAFINEVGRFPCGNSDNPNEVHLNTLFQNLGSNLSREQNQEIKKLRKIYGRATILANVAFSKKSGPKK